MKWRKLGRIHVPEGSAPWARAHAMIPTVLDRGDGLLRVFFASTDENTVGRLGYVDVDACDPTQVERIGQDPVFGIGNPGCFDDNGVNPSCIIRDGDSLRLYYVGYQLHRQVPYTLFTGLAESVDEGESFQRMSRAPVLDRTDSELYFRTAPCVRYENGRWRMWYIGGSGWRDVNGQTKPTYDLRHTESNDGITWSAASTLCLAPAGSDDEFGFGRPFVLFEHGRFRMWYSIRGHAGYRLGYAESDDGLKWDRLDHSVGIGLSDTGWDSEMICYGAIQDTPSGRYMFYNGNGYGRSGLGVAILDQA